MLDSSSSFFTAPWKRIQTSSPCPGSRARTRTWLVTGFSADRTVKATIITIPYGKARVPCTYEFDAVVNTTYCFVVRAFDTAGNESADSNEACWTAPAFVLESLSITGPASVNEGDTASYVATATFSNGDTGEATNTAVWDVEPATYASISRGQLTTWAVPSHQVVTIAASYTFGLVTKEAQKQVTIVEGGHR